LTEELGEEVGRLSRRVSSLTLQKAYCTRVGLLSLQCSSSPAPAHTKQLNIIGNLSQSISSRSLTPTQRLKRAALLVLAASSIKLAPRKATAFAELIKSSPGDWRSLCKPKPSVQLPTNPPLTVLTCAASPQVHPQHLEQLLIENQSLVEAQLALQQTVIDLRSQLTHIFVRSPATSSLNDGALDLFKTCEESRQ
jgi:hypothetical protein